MKTCAQPATRITCLLTARICDRDRIDPPFDLPDPDTPFEEPDDPSDLDEFDLPRTDDSRWDVFIPDDDERDPQPEPGDFFGSTERGARSEESD